MPSNIASTHDQNDPRVQLVRLLVKVAEIFGQGQNIPEQEVFAVLLNAAGIFSARHSNSTPPTDKIGNLVVVCRADYIKHNPESADAGAAGEVEDFPTVGRA